MGKKRHSKDPMFVSATEHKYLYGGFVQKRQLRYHSLPFDRCALSFTPFENPVCSPEGHVFDIVNVVPYLKKHGKNPVTGKPLAVKDLIKLNFHKNAEGRYCCPVTYEVFNENSHIVAIRTSGNVYSSETVEKLNIAANDWTDLVSGEKFTRADIITLQDPHRVQERNMEQFYHVQQQDEEEERRGDAEKKDSRTADAAQQQKSSITVNATMQRVMSLVNSSAASSSSSLSTTSAASTMPPPSSRAEKPGKQPPRAIHSSGAVAASFTSTSLDPQLKNEREVLSEERVREQRYMLMKGSGKKAFLRIHTSMGNINVQLHCDLAPRTCHNFLELCRQGKYDNTIFHRLIPGFMLQGGDPTGTGLGGESAWGKSPIRDETCSQLRHEGRGVLSMANSGPNTARSQFFITFGDCAWLDGKHAVFGKVVGGMDTLDAIERVPTHTKEPRKDRPKQEVRITGITIYQNPFDEPFEAVDEAEMYLRSSKNKAADEKEVPESERERGQWFSRPGGSSAGTSQGASAGVAKYLERALQERQRAEQGGDGGPSKKPKGGATQSSGQYGNFSFF